MTLKIELSPELQARLQQEAAEHGQAPEEYARALIQEKLAGPSEDDEPVYARLPRGTPEELEELARQQGVTGPVDWDALQKADFWPEEESIDDFLTTLRKWRRGED